MVETAQQLEGEQGLLDTKLEQEWTTLAKSQAATKQFLDSSVAKVLDDGQTVAFFNQKLVSAAIHTMIL